MSLVATLEVSRPPVRRWQTSYRWLGRPYGPPIAFVVHTESGGESGTVGEFLNSTSQLSAHYSVGIDGIVDCWIDLDDRCWSNGLLEDGNTWSAVAEACGVDPTLNPNHVTISCETEDHGDPTQPVSDRQFAAVLYAGVEAKLRYPDSLRYLIRHADISPQSRPNCPGDRWLSSGRFEALANTLGLQLVHC
jgi:N-acetyl-anhydromuramyl-L-alanine amidase AmpD